MGPSPTAVARALAHLLRKADGGDACLDEEAAQRVAAAGRSSGQPLPAGVRDRLETSLGTDLSGVRVHTGTDSATAAAAVGARAYTVGQDIHFAPGQYAPDDAFGVHLLAHEVAHTVQQRDAAPAANDALTVSSPGDAHEREADHFADAFTSSPIATADASPRLIAPATRVAPQLVAGVRRGVISREPDGGGGGGKICMDEVVRTLPPKELFARQTLAEFRWGGRAKDVNLFSVAGVARGVRFTAALLGSGTATMNWQAGYGAGMLQALQGRFSGCVGGEGGGSINGALNGELSVPIDVTNRMELGGAIAVKGGLPDFGGASARLEGSLTAKANAKASANITASARINVINNQAFMTVTGRIAPQLSGTADLLAGVQLLLALDLEGDKKKKKRGPGVVPGLQFGPTDPISFPKLPDFLAPKDPIVGEPRWQKAWGKRWKLHGKAWKGGWTLEQSYTFQLVGNRTDMNGIDGGSTHDVTPTPAEFPVAEFLEGLQDAPSEGENDADDGKEDGKAPVKAPPEVEIQGAARAAKAALEAAEHAVIDEQKRHERRLAIRNFGGAGNQRNEITFHSDDDDTVIDGRPPVHHRLHATYIVQLDKNGRPMSDPEREHQEDTERDVRITAARTDVVALEQRYIGAIELAEDGEDGVRQAASDELTQIAPAAAAIRDHVLTDAAREFMKGDEPPATEEIDRRIEKIRGPALAALAHAREVLGDESRWNQLALESAGKHVAFRRSLDEREQTMSRWTRALPGIDADVRRVDQLIAQPSVAAHSEAEQVLLDVEEDAREIVENVDELHHTRPQRSPEDVETAADGPTDDQLAEARRDARASLDEAQRDLRTEQSWTAQEIHWLRNDMHQHPPKGNDKPVFEEYRQTLDTRAQTIATHQREMPAHEGEFRRAENGSRSTDAERRSVALSTFGLVRDKADEIVEEIRERPERPTREHARNKYNATRDGSGFEGDFGDFPDWNGYPTAATSHPANKYSGNDGSVPEPSGDYRVPGGSTPGNMHTARWRGELYAERDRRKKELEDEHRRSNPGVPVPDQSEQAKEDIVARYEEKGYSLSWDELDLRGFEEHHIHEVYWGGPHASGNLIYLRCEEHSDVSAFWRTREADVRQELKKDD
jgi:hypothetical protein